jgi:hypothetical protein
MTNNKNLIIAKANRDVYVHVREIKIGIIVPYPIVCGIIPVHGSCDTVIGHGMLRLQDPE